MEKTNIKKINMKDIILFICVAVLAIITILPLLWILSTSFKVKLSQAVFIYFQKTLRWILTNQSYLIRHMRLRFQSFAGF